MLIMMETPEDSEEYNVILKNKMHYMLITVYLAIFFIVCMIFLIPLQEATKRGEETVGGEATTLHPQKRNCYSSELCLKEALQITQHINPKEDPCNDFYGFVCDKMQSGFRAKLGVSEELQEDMQAQIMDLYNEPDKDEDHMLVKKVKSLYRMCIQKSDENHWKDDILLTLNKAGNWPMLQPEDWKDNTFDWLERTYKFRELGFPHAIFFDVSVVVHPENQSAYILEVTLPIIDLIEKEIMIEIAEMLGIDKNTSLTEIEEIHTWKTKTIDTPHSEKNRKSTIFKVSDYQKYQLDFFNWLRFINKILSPAIQITDDVFVAFPDFAVTTYRLDMLLRKHKRAQANYMMWKAIENTVPLLIADLRRKHENKEVKKREKSCMEFIQKRFVPSPIDVMYVNKYLPIAKIDMLEELAGNVKAQLSELLRKSHWFDIEDKETCDKKLKDLTIVMGVSKDFPRDRILDELRACPKLVQDGKYIELILEFENIYQNFRYKQLHNPVNQRYFDSKHYYPFSDQKNVLVIAPYMLREFMFDETRPNCLNYGYFGSELGIIQMSVLFANKLTDEEFEQESKQLNILKYNLGIQAGYSAYKSVRNYDEEIPLIGVNYTANQLYWISSSSAWCNANLLPRKSSKSQLYYYVLQSALIGHNNINFSTDFNCPGGSRFNPLD